LYASYTSFADGLAGRLVALPAAIELLVCVDCRVDIHRWRNAFHVMQVSFKHKGETRSLISMMVDAVIAEAQRYVVTPILSRRMDEMGTWYRERMQRDTCGLSMCLGYLL
jgi:hypothetical protein